MLFCGLLLTQFREGCIYPGDIAVWIWIPVEFGVVTIPCVCAVVGFGEVVVALAVTGEEEDVVGNIGGVLWGCVQGV